MLILTRKSGESIIIGENIRVTVLEIRGKQIRLGIDAPTDIVVLREEIFQRLAQENLQAANFRHADLVEMATAMSHRSIPSPGEPDYPMETDCIPLNTRDLGRIQVGRNRLITFPSGLAGFGDFHSFALVEVPQVSPFLILQSVDESSLAFVVSDPANLVTDYRIGSVSSALKDLGMRSPKELKILNLLTIPSGQPREMTANLICPLLINPRLNLGKQVILDNPRYSLKHRVFPSELSAGANG